MGWFSKKKEEKSLLPNLPETKAELPKLPEPISQETNVGLQPISNINNKVNQNDQHQQIKNAVENKPVQSPPPPPQNNMHKSSFEPLPHYSDHEKKLPTHHEANNNMMHESLVKEIPRTAELPKPQLTKSIEPVYVRLDKFKASLESFQEIKEKIHEIESMLTKIKEIKEKEDHELEEWEKEIQIIKSRIEQIDSTVFNKLD